jgi:hypothetical protein
MQTKAGNKTYVPRGGDQHFELLAAEERSLPGVVEATGDFEQLIVINPLAEALPAIG